MKKILVIGTAVLLLLALAACGDKPAIDATQPSNEPHIDVTALPATEAPATDAPATDAPATEAPATEAPATEAPATEAPATEAPVPAEDVSYVNFDDMHFYVNGTKYTLGVSTLQEMLDAGVPFREDDLASVENNVKPNYQEKFTIVLGEYWTASVYVFNDTEEGKKASECYINEVYWSAKKDQQQDIIRFDFPFTLTMEMLKENAGEPENPYHYDGDNGYYADNFEYTKSATRYYNKNRIRFEFVKGELSSFTMTYIP